mmetsp:Transcript_9414/g.14112  ORF Transcript_9414/g.14112 Transcript_9414/m.14112 type:complete len:92 (-) Transcript_9414:847-1122(-)
MTGFGALGVSVSNRVQPSIHGSEAHNPLLRYQGSAPRGMILSPSYQLTRMKGLPRDDVNHKKGIGEAPLSRVDLQGQTKLLALGGEGALRI